MDMNEEPDTANLQAMAIQNLGIGICPASYNLHVQLETAL